jgi:hypothetical protein
MTTDSKALNSISQSKGESLSVKFRLLGLLPLGFFISHFWFYATAPYYADHRGVENMLWMCNIGNLVLAAGLFMGVKWMIRLAVLWAIPGLPLWLFEVVLHGGWLVTSFLTHIGVLMVGFPALYKVRADRRTWLHALVWFLFMQQASRMFTRPDNDPNWNVNVAHRIYGGYENIVSEYWQFWALTTLMVAAGLWVLGWILLKLFPPRSDG